MKVIVADNCRLMGELAARQAAGVINRAVEDHGAARIVLSTGASQFDTLSALVRQNVDWSRVEMFHLDEYVDLPETHPASFRKYLKERFVSRVPLKRAHFVDGTREGIAALTEELRSAPIDLGLIGIGENGHIAFNDPPADFETGEAYIVVNLDERCRRQQVGEGWFATVNDVPSQAVSMTVRQIMRCETIISCVPYAVKAEAVYKTLTSPLTPSVPATMLKQHARFSLYLDRDSAARVNVDIAARMNDNLESWEAYDRTAEA
ncbi:MAG: glucosamine-6-phosphate deaminase [Clostridiales bacterium]|nr:glucosamine-6-phosphate deaminase [Clostridiales bacterium]MDD6873774.1 glucosamine-6-phosphate deaminase [Clostridiales bacterium]MDD7366788.1 glucosamine-6-phosphate deaminase [Clostridiales bacterium]